MKHLDFLSHDEKGMVDGIVLFDTHLPSVATILGITTQQLAAINKDRQLAEWIYNGRIDAEKQMQQLTAVKNLLFYGTPGTPVQDLNLVPIADAPSTLAAGIFSRYRAMVKYIKANPNYTEQIGALLGIVGAEIVIDETQMKPKAKVKENADNKIVISITKGHSEQIAVYGNRVSDGDPALAPGQDEKFDFIQVVSHPPYNDFRLNKARKPETRKYKFYYMKNDKIVGQASDVITVPARIYLAADGNEMAPDLT